MMDKSGILDKELADLADNAIDIFNKKLNIANGLISNIPESESKIKGQLQGIMKEAKSKDANPNEIIAKLNKIVNAIQN